MVPASERCQRPGWSTRCAGEPRHFSCRTACVRSGRSGYCRRRCARRLQLGTFRCATRKRAKTIHPDTIIMASPAHPIDDSDEVERDDLRRLGSRQLAPPDRAMWPGKHGTRSRRAPQLRKDADGARPQAQIADTRPIVAEPDARPAWWSVPFHATHQMMWADATAFCGNCGAYTETVRAALLAKECKSAKRCLSALILRQRMLDGFHPTDVPRRRFHSGAPVSLCRAQLATSASSSSGPPSGQSAWSHVLPRAVSSGQAAESGHTEGDNPECTPPESQEWASALDIALCHSSAQPEPSEATQATPARKKQRVAGGGPSRATGATHESHTMKPRNAAGVLYCGVCAACTSSTSSVVRGALVELCAGPPASGSSRARSLGRLDRGLNYN